MVNKKNKKQVLGKGLDSIFTDLGIKNKTGNEQEVVSQIPLDKIEVNPFQPRKVFKKEEIEDLSQSIDQQGLLQPILLRSQANGCFQIIAGERRFRAFKRLSKKTISACVRDKITDRQMMEFSIIENIQRVQLNIMEEAKSYAQLIEKCGLTHQDLAIKLSKSRSYITNTLRLLSLTEYVQQLVLDKKLSMGIVRTLITLPPVEQRLKAQKFLEKKINVRGAEQELNSKKQTVIKKKPLNNHMDVDLKADLKELQYFTGSSVELKGNIQKGFIEIQYNSQEELEQIIHRILFEHKY